MEIIPALILIIMYIFIFIFGISALVAVYWGLCGDIIERRMKIRKSRE